MALIFGLISFFLAAGIGVIGYLFSQQATVLRSLSSTAKTSAEELSKCRESYTELKTKAETQLRGLMQKLKEETAKAEHIHRIAVAQAEKMKRWQVLIDAEAEAKRIVVEARSQADELRTTAEREAAESEARVQGADRQAERIIHLAEREADVLKTDALALHEKAGERARELIADAEKQAEEIAGEGYEIKRNIAKYERMLKAVKNQIDGYGDEYIVPTQSLLDDLAEEVGYAEAGRKLQEIRARVRQMVNDGQAAECDYAEANRRETAVRFITDAFNGKVDSILSRVKADNGGKLRQQIQDAFALVNGNGEAFRNARITESFLQARLEELKWACIAQEIKKQEQEEQRRIKERIREEEKAKREFEKAIKAAAKEEENMKKAEAKLREQMDRAAAEERDRMAKATAEERDQLKLAAEAQRAKYEAELAAIQAKMLEIEEKGRRAMSMAQQTKKGNVYIISNIGSFGEHVYKIGLTRRLDPHERIRELGDSSVPFEFDVHALIEAEDAPALEHRLHKHFVLHQVNKVNHRKEFFRCDLATIRSEVESLGLTSTWTMAAAAQDYRETLVIEKRIADDPLAKQRWMERQYDLESAEDDGATELVGAGAGDFDDEGER